MTNLSLDKLRKGTGAFISESDFQVIQLEYLDYLEENGLIDAEANAEKFCEIWVEEQENLDTFNSFLEQLQGDLDIPGFDEDILKQMVSDAEDVTEKLSEYGKYYQCRHSIRCRCNTSWIWLLI